MNERLNEPAHPREPAGVRGWKAKGGVGAMLPPPVFPPGGQRSRTRRRPVSDSAERAGEGHPSVWSDTSIWVRAGLGAALILPDDPIPARAGGLVPGEVAGSLDLGASGALGGERTDEVNPDDIVVTGIGDDPHLSAGDLLYSWDPDVTELVGAVKKLAADLERDGEAALLAAPGMTHLERQLRAYCVGFLAGRRAVAISD